MLLSHMYKYDGGAGGGFDDVYYVIFVIAIYTYLFIAIYKTKIYIYAYYSDCIQKYYEDKFQHKNGYSTQLGTNIFIYIQ